MLPFSNAMKTGGFLNSNIQLNTTAETQYIIAHMWPLIAPADV